VHINRIKDKNHRIISIDVENAIDKNLTSFCDKGLKKLVIKGKYLKTIKDCIGKAYSQYHSPWVKTETISSIVWNKTKVSTLKLYWRHR
jgi:hypothetical protein